MKLVIDTSRPIAQVARELGIGEGTLGNWVATYRRDHAGEEPPLDVSDRARLREVERQLREAEPADWASVSELPAARARLAAADQRAKVVANPIARPATRARAATDAKAALLLLMNGALRHVGTEEEKQWWALHRTASDLRDTVTREAEKLRAPPPTSTQRTTSTKASGTAKKGKTKKKKRGNALPPLDTSPEARHKRDAASKKRYDARPPIKLMPGGLPTLGKR